jgi:RimJ/RimL family protein N-acetyltransferase
MATILTPAIDLFSTPKTDRVAPVALRQIRPDDAPALQAFVRDLSPASRRLRFHAALNELTESGVRALTQVDQRAHVAFVLTTAERGAERIVGEARYVVATDKETAEFAIAVADEFRGRGLAERLVAALICAARTAGLRWLVGEVLAGNARMLAFARRCGFAETTRGGLEPGVVRVERCVDGPLPVAQAATSFTAVAYRRVRRLLAALSPSPRQAVFDFQPF